MYAIVDIAGHQYKVQKDQRIYVHRLETKEGGKVEFDRVLLIDNNGKVNVGAPAIEGATVKATVLQHLKGDKVIVFKKKRRKGYQKSNGHRQYLSQILIEGIVEGGTKKKAAAKPKKAEEAPAKKETAKAKPAKAEATKEAAAEKPAVEKAETPAVEEAPKAEAPAAKEETKAEAAPAAEEKAEAPASEESPAADSKESDDKE